ncbi:MAG: right-handed parallel beta-helix repeat-containing protein, partial [Chloroflexi bacterium]|nr:right-handed parallel beta-helix repeat-containing protein [Chloroflexota bacterium]
PQPVYAAGPVTTCTESALRIALTGGGLVTFTCGPATITLTAPITVTRSTTIDGGGLITFLGDGNSRIFDVTDNSVPNFELKLIGLTVSGGRADSGGAVVVDNGNTVTVVNSTLSNNVVQARGGAIYAASAATVNITNSTVISNLAGGSGSAEGGAIYTMFATVNIVNSAIISNTVSDNRDGGGMYNFESDLILVNSTLSHNNTGNRGGALVVNQSTALITNTTISGNSATRGGGLVIFNGGTVNTKNTIIAGNTAPSGGPDCDFDSVTSQGYNLIGDTSGCTITGDLTGNITNQNPLLGSLADNGGAT